MKSNMDTLRTKSEIFEDAHDSDDNRNSSSNNPKRQLQTAAGKAAPCEGLEGFDKECVGLSGWHYTTGAEGIS